MFIVRCCSDRAPFCNSWVFCLMFSMCAKLISIGKEGNLLRIFESWAGWLQMALLFVKKCLKHFAFDEEEHKMPNSTYSKSLKSIHVAEKEIEAIHILLSSSKYCAHPISKNSFVFGPSLMNVISHFSDNNLHIPLRLDSFCSFMLSDDSGNSFLKSFWSNSVA